MYKSINQKDSKLYSILFWQQVNLFKFYDKLCTSEANPFLQHQKSGGHVPSQQNEICHWDWQFEVYSNVNDFQHCQHLDEISSLSSSQLGYP